MTTTQRKKSNLREVLIICETRFLGTLISSHINEQDSLIASIVDLQELKKMETGGDLSSKILNSDCLIIDSIGFSQIQKNLDKYEVPKKILIGSPKNCSDVSSLLEEGVFGLLPAKIEADLFFHALWIVLFGESYFHQDAWLPDLRSATAYNLRLASSSSTGHVTPRESDVLGALTSGQSNKVIARKLGITEETVKMYVSRLLIKLEATNRTELALKSFAMKEIVRDRPV